MVFNYPSIEIVSDYRLVHILNSQQRVVWKVKFVRVHFR